MFELTILVSSWITAALLMSIAWSVYRYSKDMAVEINYWNRISSGVLFLAASEIIRPLFMMENSLFWIFWLLSAIGGSMIAYGFYGLYEEERV